MGSTPDRGAPGTRSGSGPGQRTSRRYVPRHSRQSTPVPRAETRVTGRRVIQYPLDVILSSVIPAVLYWALRRDHGEEYVVSMAVAAFVSLICYAWYWVIVPDQTQGQTFGMQLLRVRVISKDGGPADVAQLVMRLLVLVFDGLLAGLVGLVVMLLSRHRQRLGDHLARTLVVKAGWQGAVQYAPGERRPAAAAGQAYTGGASQGLPCANSR
jgi:uncharacterized RDD family membrane protein YckC